MKTHLTTTQDGSHTLFSTDFGVHYHSIHGALQESQHIFLDLGLRPLLAKKPSQIYVFEMGFGTGLNALLTCLEATNYQIPIHYVALEAYPVGLAQVQTLNYGQVLDTPLLLPLHQAACGEAVGITAYFTLEKYHTTLQNFDTTHRFDAVYYDAFAPDTQPELWTQEIFEKIAGWLTLGANLTTYCSKGYVQRNLKGAGFRVEKHPGPARKREVLRAYFE